LKRRRAREKGLKRTAYSLKAVDRACRKTPLQVMEAF
jgi:hypothetical protein